MDEQQAVAIVAALKSENACGRVLAAMRRKRTVGGRRCKLEPILKAPRFKL